MPNTNLKYLEPKQRENVTAEEKNGSSLMEVAIDPWKRMSEAMYVFHKQAEKRGGKVKVIRCM